MCVDPGTLAVIFTVGQGMMEYQQISNQNKAQIAMYRNQEQAALQNARMQERQGERMVEAYTEEQRRLDARMRLARGQQRAAAGASGIQGGLGSGLDVLGSSLDAYYGDTLALAGNKDHDMWGNRIQQVNYLNDAASANSAAHNAKVQGRMAKFSSLLSTAGSLAGQFAGGGSKGAGFSSAKQMSPYGGSNYKFSGGFSPVAQGSFKVGGGFNPYASMNPYAGKSLKFKGGW